MNDLARGTYERATQLYKELLREVRDNTSEEILIDEVFVRSEILKRDFSKRQQNILWMVFTFSLAYGKKKAVIPQIQDFSLSGVGKNKVREELDKLIEMNVIKVDEAFNTYEINSPLYWDAPHHSHFDDSRSRELFFINLIDAGVKKEIIDDIISKMILAKL